MIGRNRHLASLLALATLGAPASAPFGVAPIPDTTSRESHRRSTSNRRILTPDWVRQQRAAAKRARKAAKRLRDAERGTVKAEETDA